MNSETKNCQNCKKDFTIEPDDFSFYEKMKVPPPTFCPECRNQRRLVWRNEFSFYNRNCDLCKRSIISQYSSETPLTIYCNKCWWGDEWDPKSFGEDIDWDKPFMEQFSLLRGKVPALALINDNGIGSINCDYTQNFALGKDCYMVMVAWKWEGCMYSTYGVDTKFAVDSLGAYNGCDSVYESMFVRQCYNCRFVYESISMIDCAFCFDCRDCTECFMCTGLRHTKFCFKNVQYTEAEYLEIKRNYKLDTWSGQEKAKKEFFDFKKTVPHQSSSLKNCVNCTGNYLFNSKNSKYAFNATGLEDCKYFETGDTLKDCHDVSVGGEAELCYECVTPDNSQNSLSTVYTWKSTNVSYCDFCQASNNCFGCVGLKKGEYCIFNKQYSKEEYKELVVKLIEKMKKEGLWGEFFPKEYSLFGYNETIAHLNMPLTRDEALSQGFKWQDNLQITTGKETIQNKDIPDSISDTSDSIVNEILKCQECNRNYKIVEAELLFYKKYGIPIPRKCFFCRLSNRFLLKNPSRLWTRNCMCEKDNHNHEGNCPNEFETTYSPERSEKIYCEQCYQKEFN